MKVMELSGMKLRRALCEELGLKPAITWIASRDGGDSMAMEFERQDYCEIWCATHPPYATVRHETCPALESSPGVFWSEFEKWRKSFEVNKPGFELRDGPRNGREDISYRFFVQALIAKGWCEVCGKSDTSITEAGCRAWLQAIQALKEK